MSKLKQLHHAMTINRTLIKYGLDEFLAPTPIAKFRFIAKIFSLTSSQHKDKSRGKRLAMALTELGPIYIKLGQMLSTRRDIIPPDIADDLAKLQDQVEPFDNEKAIQVIESQLEQPLTSVFTSFEQSPLASASIAQVHAAVLKDGQDVVVKVLRPGIRKKIQKDLDMMHSLAQWAEKYSSEARRFRIKEVVKDYDETIKREIDLRIEAANCSNLRGNFEGSELLYVPKVYWDYCRNKVMVMERISGVPVGEVQQLIDAGVDMQELANRGVEIFFTQVFRDSFFHADMHPGNIFVDISNPSKPQYIAIDCGIMGTLNESDKRYLADNFLAFFDQNYRRIAELHIESGWIDKNVSVTEFESAIRAACEPIFGKKISEISFGHFLIQLFQTARKFNMQVQPQLVLLQKTLLYIEGLGRQLYPELDLWETAQPFLRQWIKDKYSPINFFKQMKQEAPQILEELPKVPGKIIKAVDQVNHLAESFDDIKQQMVELETHKLRQQYAQKYAVIGSSLAITAGLIYTAMPNNFWPAVGLGLGAAYFLIKSLWPATK
ncbi:ubiquinone biosynthesis regulatory protein kinase UbiB [Kangiella sp. HZ709]|uniref:ubiquinone biosynthesis regulatory protein kinase UbiB n=1 Tax=Kangiella sp. HZ709 TaxID=2666328 RepID=UPI0012B0B87F|nr:ubiquinone biosynthesis regulatory protein kinase UbiB [Kangiella sp. HZ709]MRX28260.1 ubiquinone biosynthesis regulatory protein kinase UbiB [Kangiella sp. HZ709]